MDQGDRIYMVELLAQLKEATAGYDEANEAMQRWIGRMGVAKEARDRELWEGARDKAVEAEEKMRRMESVVMELEVERDNLKRKASEPKVDPGVVRANHLIEQFKEMGIDPEEAVFHKMEKKAEAESALDALKKRMQDD